MKQWSSRIGQPCSAAMPGNCRRVSSSQRDTSAARRLSGPSLHAAGSSRLIRWSVAVMPSLQLAPDAEIQPETLCNRSPLPPMHPTVIRATTS